MTRGSWGALWTRLAADRRFDLIGMRQAWLRRQVAARMRAQGVETYDEYLSLLDSHPSEFAALSSALRSHLRRASPRSGPRRPPARGWVDALPVAALLAEAAPATGRLRLLCGNHLAHDLLTAPELALEAAGRRHQWLFPDLTPCTDEDMPLQRAIRQGVPTHGQTLVLRDTRGRLRALVVSARCVGGHGPARAIATFQAAPAWQDEEGDGALLARLNESQAVRTRYQRLFEESPAPLLLTDAGGKVEEANYEAAALLRAAAPLAGSELAAHLADDAAPALEEALRSAQSAPEARAQMRLRRRPGQVVEARVRRMAGDDYPVVQWALRDVTAEAEVERQRRDLTDLMLHDLRSPLATALLGVETVGRVLQRGEPARVERPLATAHAALRRLGRVVDSLLDISRLEEGQMPLQLSEFAADEMLAEVAREAELVMSLHGLRLELEVAPNVPTVLADRDMLYRAVLNLLDNAIKFSPPQGQVWLHAGARDGGLVLSVADQGPGIPPEFLPHIFDKFVGLQLPHAPRGYGLGLAFCKLAVEAHRGRVGVASRVGEGSVFTLWLPTRPDTAEAPSTLP